MTIQQAKSIGGTQLLKSATFLLLLFEVVMLYIETKGDFANGILFFLEAQMNGYFILLLLLYFGLMFFLGRQAGVLIICRNIKHYLIAGLFAVSTTILFSGTIAILGLLINSEAVYERFHNYDARSVMLQSVFILFIFMCLVWLWATNRIHIKKRDS
jgi:hypothetical protein